jgi:hypothetical protein
MSYRVKLESLGDVAPKLGVLRPWLSGPLLVLAAQLLLAVIVGASAFFLNRNNLLGYIDGQYLLTLGKNQSEFMDRTFSLSTNPLQGLGDLWFFTNTTWIPELSVSRLVSDPGWQRVAVHTVAFVEIFCVTFLLANWLYASPAKAVASAWLAVLMIMPITYPALIFNISGDAPELATLIALPLIIVPLWSQIGRAAHPLDALCIVSIAVLLWLHFIAFGLFTAVVYPFLVIVALVFVAASWNSKIEFWRKIIWGSFLVLLLAASGLPQALLGITFDTAIYFFPKQLMRSARDLSDGSILLRPREPVGVIVAGMGILGASYHVGFGCERSRRFASAFLIIVALLLFGSILYRRAGGSPASPIYYEYVLWPVYAVFAVGFLAIPWNVIWRNFSVLLPRFAKSGLQWVVLPLAALALLHGRNYLAGVPNERPNVYPPQKTNLSEYLRGEIGLAPGAPFKGRVVTMTGQNFPLGATWEQMFDFDMRLIRAVGNDHRTIGLWYYGIPTLIEFSHTVPPLLYAIVERYLAYGDPQFRTILHMRHPNIPVLRMLGVRYVLTDRHGPFAGTRRVSELPLSEQRSTLAIDEIPNPNVGVSPTKIIPLVSTNEAFAWVSSAENDFERAAILDGPDPGPLSRAIDINIWIERDGIRVRAKNTGQSLVVIPFHFSHCLRAISRNEQLPPPELRRANLALTGLLLSGSGNVDVTIQYRQGPFQNMRCRLDDLADDKRLSPSQ